jgi:ribosomal protein S18 acetylase RimI-like enzyme
MPSIIARDFAGPEDFRTMQRLTQSVWDRDRPFHAGALAWERYEHIGREPDWPTRLWFDGERLLAWAWLYEHDPDVLYVQIHPDHPSLMDAALDWWETVATANRLEVLVFDPDHLLRERLVARGFAPSPQSPFGLHTQRRLTELPPLVLPPGHRVVTMAESPDPDRRAAAHRAAWDRIAGREHLPPGGSRVIGESYRAVMAAWLYRPELDVVLEAPDGRWVANCCVWFDDANGVGAFEPVGVDADCRRRGLGYAVCLAGLHALEAAGATMATVGARGDDDYPVPRRLYFSLGFRTQARSCVFSRPRLNR